MTVDVSLHDEVGLRLSAADQRYTAQRRMLIDILAGAGRPITIAEILTCGPELTQSSVYRNVTALMEVGAVERIAGTDDYGRFELAEALSGHHHHHLVCTVCGKMEDLKSSSKLERALHEAGRIAAEEQGYVVSEHRLDLYGRCGSCQDG